MKKELVIVIVTVLILLAAFKRANKEQPYTQLYFEQLQLLKQGVDQLNTLVTLDTANALSRQKIQQALEKSRLAVKQMDFWLRYLEPTVYKLLNGPLPVEYETEVHEKFEKPYRREGAGLTLFQLAFDEQQPYASLQPLIQSAQKGLAIFESDSITALLKNENHLLLCNRLFLLNLAAIYTTGFECPDTNRILPELNQLVGGVNDIYKTWTMDHPNYFDARYLQLYSNMYAYIQTCRNYQQFNHFALIRDFVNPLFQLNQQMIRTKKIVSSSFIDYSLNTTASSIFSKSLYSAQNTKGIFGKITDRNILNEIKEVGRLLFHDPILSGDNQRSCSSCHSPEQFFTDTTVVTHFEFGKKQRLTRNTPSLLNSSFNHLLMYDGKHYSLIAQAKAVMTNPQEMNSKETEIMEKVLSCRDYNKRFTNWCQYTPAYPKPSFEHLASALIMYYTSFDQAVAPFDQMMNQQRATDTVVEKGFNLFMGKAQCGTCHFVPLFNGVKPPYTGSEFEVLGVPADTSYAKGDTDLGRSLVFDAPEMRYAFRTGTVRNAAVTAPYMHNGVFTTLDQVVEFYNQGGGAGKGLNYPHQTLSAEKLNLNTLEKQQLIVFIRSLTENLRDSTAIKTLPTSKRKLLTTRTVNGSY